MSRLVDYFLICGYDHSKIRNKNESSSRVVQRFPEKDWPDVPFLAGMDLFCQPNGWSLSPDRQSPKFFVLVMTDEGGTRLHCPVLTFSEAIRKDDLGNFC